MADERFLSGLVWPDRLAEVGPISRARLAMADPGRYRAQLVDELVVELAPEYGQDAAELAPDDPLLRFIRADAEQRLDASGESPS